MEADPSVEHHDIDDDKTMIRLHKEQKKRGDKDNRDRRNRDPDHDMHRLSEKRKSALKVENFGGDPVLAPYDDKDALKSELMLLVGTLCLRIHMFVDIAPPPK